MAMTDPVTRLHERRMLTVVGVILAAAAFGLSWPFVFSNILPPMVWRVAFVAAGFLTIGWALNLPSRFLYLASGLTVGLVTLSRAAALIFIAHNLTAAASWLAVTAMAGYVWPSIRSDQLSRDGGLR